MTPMDLFGLRADSARMQEVFAYFNTLRRPELADRYSYHDWVLVRRAGVELGFSEENYHRGELPQLWGKGALLFTQVYFYAGFDDVARYTQALPFGVSWADTREQVRARLTELAPTLHSSDVSDTWDGPGYRVTVHYAAEPQQRPDKVVCRQLAHSAAPPKDAQAMPKAQWMAQHWGASVAAPEWRSAWGQYLSDKALKQGMEEGAIELSQSHGVTLHVNADAGEPLLRALSFFGNQHENAVQWPGALPFGLSFEDSPHTLFQKVKAKPEKRQDGELTGYAVWHHQDFTVHVLYSFVDNRILRVKLLAPGTWRSAKD